MSTHPVTPQKQWCQHAMPPLFQQTGQLCFRLWHCTQDPTPSPQGHECTYCLALPPSQAPPSFRTKARPQPHHHLSGMQALHHITLSMLRPHPLLLDPIRPRLQGPPSWLLHTGAHASFAGPLYLETSPTPCQTHTHRCFCSVPHPLPPSH